MRELIKKWLGININHPNQEEIELIVENQIRQTVKDAFRELFDEQNSLLFWGTGEKVYLYNEFKNRVHDFAGTYIYSKSDKIIKELIEPEKFIDAVVERIKKKQLK